MDWASIIGIGLQFLGQKQASDASVGAASDYNTALIEAAKPKTVYDPTASAVWDEATQSYVLAPSSPMMGLFGANLQDAYRQRAMIEPYMRDPESAALTRMRETQAALEPSRSSVTEDLLGRLNRRGLLGSTIGAQATAELDRQRAVEDAALLQQSRGGVQSDITNYINRANLAAQNAASYGSIGQNLANIGTGLGSSAYTAAAQGGQGLMNAQAASGFGYGQIPYALGQNLMGYKKDPAINLSLQSEYLGRPSGYMGSVF
jgi:hypothetical protein